APLPPRTMPVARSRQRPRSRIRHLAPRGSQCHTSPQHRRSIVHQTDSSPASTAGWGLQWSQGMMRSARFASLVMVALLVGQARLAVADSFLPKDFSQLVAEAEEIFIGTLTGTSSSRLPTGAIVTDLTFSDVKVLKGGTSGDERTVRILGG